MKFRLGKKLMMFASAVVFVMIFQSCKDDPKPVVQQGEAGFFVVNEGGFGNSNTSISFYDRKTDVITNNIFAEKNGRSLGDQTQSMTVFGDRGYIVVQNSKKIEVINATDFSSLATITTGITSPRYFVGISTTKGYVSDWGADGKTGTVKVIDLATNTVTKTISTGLGSNRMLKVGTLVYVANSGGFGKDNTVKIIDSNTDEVIGSITTADNPNSLQLDKDGNIWVAASGATVYGGPPTYSVDEAKSTKGSISKINSANTEVLRLTVEKVTSGAGNLNISPDGKTLYYTNNSAIYSVATSSTALPTSAFISKNYYGLAVDPINGNVIACQVPNFSSAGNIDIYDATGNLKKTYVVGIAPNGVAFK